MQVLPGSPHPLGATWDGEGVNFALYSENGTAVELCLFDEDGREARVPLPHRTAFVWHGYVPGLTPGQRLTDVQTAAIGVLQRVSFPLAATMRQHKKVLAELKDPLLRPEGNEREGYVPNVVYTCGALVHHGELIIPYGLADHSTGFATVPLAEVLAAMQPPLQSQ